MRGKKYTGGSKQALFILPIIGYKSTRARVNALLDQIAYEMNLEVQNSVKPLPASAKTTFDAKDKIRPIRYICGCSVIDGLFRRQAGCSKAKVQH